MKKQQRKMMAALGFGVILALSAVGPMPIHALDEAGDTFINIDVEKVWVDSNNADSTRPESVTVDLKNGENVVSSITITPDEAGKWTGVFNEVPRYDEQGNEITYTVEEQPVEGYESSVEQGEIISDYSYPTNISDAELDVTTKTTDTVNVTGSTTYKIQPGLRTDTIAATQVVFNSSALTINQNTVLHEYDADGVDVTGTASAVFSRSNAQINMSGLGNQKNIYVYTDHYFTLTFPNAVTILDGTSTGSTVDAVLTVSNISVYKNTNSAQIRLIYYSGGLWVGSGSNNGLSMDLNFKVPGVDEGQVLISFVDIDVTGNISGDKDNDPRNESVYLMGGVEDTIYTLPLTTTATTGVEHTFFKAYSKDGKTYLRAYSKSQDGPGTLQSGFVARANLSSDGFNLRWTGGNCATKLFSEVKPFALKATVDQKTAGGSGGTISEQHDWEYRNYGEAKVITMTPNKGYHIETITIDGKDVDLDGFDEKGEMTVTATGWTENGRTGKEDITLYQRADGVVDVYLPKQFYAVGNTAPARTDHWIDVSYTPNGVAQNYTITNTLTNDISGTKTWVAGTASHVENTALNLTLMQKVEDADDSTAVKYNYDAATQLSWDGNTYTIKDIPKYSSEGQKYVYTIEEAAVSGFDTTYDETHLNITNTLKQETIEVRGRKYWYDGGKYTHDNTEELTVKLYRKSAKAGSVREEVEVAPVWNGDVYSFPDLPKYDDERYAYTYTVSEQMIDTTPDYLKEGEYYDCQTDATGLSFINTLKGTTSFSGTKTWIDPGKTHNNSSDVTLVLYWESKTVNKRQTGGQYAVTWDGDAYTYTSLPKYDDKGYPYTYSVRESKVMGKSANVADYAISYDGGPDWDRKDYNVTGTNITNRLSGTTEVTGTKTWVNGTAVTEHDNEKEVILTLYRTSAKEGSVQETVEDAVPTWNEDTYTFANLPLYDMEGYKYTYTVSEAPVQYYETTQDGFNFTNTYILEPVKYAIPVKKVLNADEGLEAPDIKEKYTFTLKEGEDVIDEKKNPDADGGTFSFNELTYDKAGIYTYTVTESGSVKGVDNDTTSTKTVTVTVKDSGKGTLYIESATSTEESPLTFTNTYSVKTLSVPIPVTKTLQKGEGLQGPDITQAYTFTIADDPSDAVDSPLPYPTAVTNPASNGGTVSFSDITYTKAGTYSYKITESGSVAGVTNDESAEKTVTVIVTEEEDGTLSATVNGGNAVEFVNTYSAAPVSAAITVQKNLLVPEGMTAPDITNAFTFTIADDPSDDIDSPLPSVTSITNPEAAGGQAGFEAVTYSAPGTYRYLITESESVADVINDAASVKTVTVVVTDAKNGELTAVVNSDGSPVQFNNSYKEAKVVLTAEKILKTADSSLLPPDITGKYTFTLKQDGSTIEEKTNPGAAGGTVTFSPITFTEPGTYTYTIVESGSVSGITNDAEAEKTVTVKVESTGDGTLTVSVNDGKPVQFVNTYSVTPVSAVISAEKTLSARSGLIPPDITGKYTFALKEGDTLIEEKTNPDSDGGTVEFSEIEYTKPGEYTYTITESGSVSGITNDAVSTREVSVVVSDNGDGTLSAAVNGGTVPEFVNTYNADEVSVYINVNKTLTYEDGLIPGDIKGKFTFTLTAEDGTPMPAVTEVTNPDVSGGTAAFGPITFKDPDTYTYTVTESGSVPCITNDEEASKTVTIKVEDAGDGSLKATVNDGKEVIFTNTYEVKPVTADIPVKKVLECSGSGTPADQTGKFTFTLTAENGTPMPAVTQVTNPDPDGGTAVFKGIEFSKPGTYTYTVTESGKSDGVTNDPQASKTVTVKVTDNSDGTLKAVVNNGTVLTFTNTYGAKPVTIDPPVVKRIAGGRPRTAEVFYFTMIAQDGAPMMAGASNGRKTVSVTGAGETEFGVITYTEEGVYTYTIVEENTGIAGYTYDPSVWTIRVTVRDDGKGQLTAEKVCQKDGKTEEKAVFTNWYNAVIVPDTSDHTNIAVWSLALVLSVFTAFLSSRILRKH